MKGNGRTANGTKELVYEGEGKVGRQIGEYALKIFFRCSGNTSCFFSRGLLPLEKAFVRSTSVFLFEIPSRPLSCFKVLRRGKVQLPFHKY